ncbi:MAG: hypothetical protein JNL66_07710 [Alphaproteobacteria bacterium]|nr:hypothetical protein [Alphaproteobacteria bacterium]
MDSEAKAERAARAAKTRVGAFLRRNRSHATTAAIAAFIGLWIGWRLARAFGAG